MTIKNPNPLNSDGRPQWSIDSWHQSGPPVTITKNDFARLSNFETDLYQSLNSWIYVLKPAPSQPVREGADRLKDIRRKVAAIEEAEKGEPEGPDVRSESYLLGLDSHARINQIRKNNYEDYELEKVKNVKSGKWPARFLNMTKKAIETELRNQRLRGEKV